MDQEDVIPSQTKKKNSSGDKSVINPLAYPWKKSLGSNHKAFESYLVELCTQDKEGEKEENYNRSYSYKKANGGKPFGPGSGYLVLDQILPQNIELGDIIKYTKDTTYIYHVKEELGQETRVVLSQVLNAAKELRSALSTNQPQDFLQMMWHKRDYNRKQGRLEVADQRSNAFAWKRSISQNFYQQENCFHLRIIRKPREIASTGDQYPYLSILKRFPG